MLIIYFKKSGEIYQVASPYKNLKEFYGYHADEFGLIFDYIYLDVMNDYLFNRYIDFKVDLKTKKLVYKDSELLNQILN